MQFQNPPGLTPNQSPAPTLLPYWPGLPCSPEGVSLEVITAPCFKATELALNGGRRLSLTLPGRLPGADGMQLGEAWHLLFPLALRNCSLLVHLPSLLLWLDTGTEG